MQPRRHLEVAPHKSYNRAARRAALALPAADGRVVSVSISGDVRRGLQDS